MFQPRVAVLPLFALALAACLPASAQSVISTHSGVLYFFEGSVFIGDEQVQQKFGKFPAIGEGGELRTERGRAEVLLTPGVFLRIGESSSIRMISNQLANTRVELLSGSAILESNEAEAPSGPDTSVELIHKNWHVWVPRHGVYRIDSEPPQVQVFKGEAEVSNGPGGRPELTTVAVKEGEILPLAEVLVAEKPASAPADGFKTWAMSRSQAVSADNAVAAGILDDPSQIDSSGLTVGGFSYFPFGGIAPLGIPKPYGLSFWSPYQSTMNSLYFPPYLYRFYPGWPSGVRYLPVRPPIAPRSGIGSPGGLRTPGVPFTPRPGTPPRAGPRVGVHGGGRR
jgi:hypothetical protein